MFFWTSQKIGQSRIPSKTIWDEKDFFSGFCSGECWQGSKQSVVPGALWCALQCGSVVNWSSVLCMRVVMSRQDLVLCICCLLLQDINVMQRGEKNIYMLVYAGLVALIDWVVCILTSTPYQQSNRLVLNALNISLTYTHTHTHNDLCRAACGSDIACGYFLSHTLLILYQIKHTL